MTFDNTHCPEGELVYIDSDKKRAELSAAVIPQIRNYYINNDVQEFWVGGHTDTFIRYKILGFILHDSLYMNVMYR